MSGYAYMVSSSIPDATEEEQEIEREEIIIGKEDND